MGGGPENGILSVFILIVGVGVRFEFFRDFLCFIAENIAYFCVCFIPERVHHFNIVDQREMQPVIVFSGGDITHGIHQFSKDSTVHIFLFVIPERTAVPYQIDQFIVRGIFSRRQTIFHTQTVHREGSRRADHHAMTAVHTAAVAFFRCDTGIIRFGIHFNGAVLTFVDAETAPDTFFLFDFQIDLCSDHIHTPAAVSIAVPVIKIADIQKKTSTPFEKNKTLSILLIGG